MKTFKKGLKITNLDVISKQDFIYWHEKVYHKGWFLSWQTRFLLKQIQLGLIYYAIKIKKDEGTKC
jgi:hypothetical protein